MTPRRTFHLLLGAIFLPILALPLVWIGAAYWLRRAREDEDRRWARRILALAVVDTVVIAILGAVVASGAASGQARIESAPAAPRPRVAIGVMPDSAYGGPGVRLQRVFPDGPAAAAGLVAGDVILRLAGEEISKPEALRKVVGEQEPGVPVPLEVARGASTSTVEITPRRSSELRRPRVGFLEPMERLDARACLPPPRPISLLPLAAILGALAALAVLVARRSPDAGAGRGVWWTAASVIAAGVGGYAVPAGACALLGGHTPAGGTLSLWASSLALGGTALAGRRLVGDAPAPAPGRTWGSAVKLGIWYLVTGAPRVAVVTFALAQLGGGRAPGSGPVESLVGAVQGPALLLLAVPTLLIGPAGEEVAFRGLLQPALGRWLEPAAAVAVTSVLFASLHWYYGLRLPVLLFVAAVLGWARVASGGLRAPIVLHMLVNGATFALVAVSALRRG